MMVSVHSKLDIVPITDPAGRGRELHRGIKAYLDGKNFLAPLENPRTILDIGYGTNICICGLQECAADSSYHPALSPELVQARGYGKSHPPLFRLYILISIVLLFGHARQGD